MSDPIILIADDNEPTRAMMASVLTSIGYQVVQAVDGSSALKVVHDYPISLAILDQYMEPMGGFEFAKHVQAASDMPKFPMVMITAHETSDLLTKTQELGFFQIMQKPVQPNRLVMVVERALKAAKK